MARTPDVRLRNPAMPVHSLPTASNSWKSRPNRRWRWTAPRRGTRDGQGTRWKKTKMAPKTRLRQGLGLFHRAQGPQRGANCPGNLATAIPSNAQPGNAPPFSLALLARCHFAVLAGAKFQLLLAPSPWPVPCPSVRLSSSGTATPTCCLVLCLVPHLSCLVTFRTYFTRLC
jgi:hypothetical protein